MELSLVALDTQTHWYTLRLAGLPESTGPGTTPVGPAWVDDALTAIVHVLDAHRVHSTNTYFAYRARETMQRPKHTAGKTTTARVASDLHDDMPLLADIFVITQLAVLVSLKASGVANAIDIYLVVECLRDDAPVPPADDIGDVTLVSETGAGMQSMTSRRQRTRQRLRAHYAWVVSVR